MTVARRPARKGRRLTVLGWHNIAGTPCFPSPPGAGVEGFRRQLDWLARWTSVVDLGDALAALRAGDPLPPRAVAITFDDGYRDNLDLAAPELQRRDMPATFFLVPGLIDRQSDPWWETAASAIARSEMRRLEWDGTVHDLSGGHRRRDAYRRVVARLKTLDGTARRDALTRLLDALRTSADDGLADLFVDRDGARDLVRLGFVVGSHSRDHAILSRERPDDQRLDLAESRARLEEVVRRPVRLLAYPNGDYTADTVAAAEAAGYDYGVTTRRGVNRQGTHPYEIRRFVVYPERGTRLLRTMFEIGSRRVRRLAGGWFT